MFTLFNHLSIVKVNLCKNICLGIYNYISVSHSSVRRPILAHNILFFGPQEIQVTN
jgi:hypothetical protein